MPPPAAPARPSPTSPARPSGPPAPAPLPWPSLHDYGVVGDLRSAALVSRHGGVDWMCWPRFDSPSVFARLLDPAAGHFAVAPTATYRSSQRYEPGTNVLQTRFETATGRACLEAFMPLAGDDGHDYGAHELRLRLAVEAGHVEAAVEFAPRLGYGLMPTGLEARTHGVLARQGAESVALSTRAPLSLSGEGAGATTASGLWQGKAGDTLGFALRHDEGHVRAFDDDEHDEAREETVDFWQDWCYRGRYEGPWQGQVRRSALALRLLTYSPTGALVAAATTSLPEAAGGSRNWDYRYSWIRDASFTVSALGGLGYGREARQYVRWLHRLLRGSFGGLGSLQVCYGVEGETDLAESELGHLGGFAGSRPVRIGNLAARQSQLDIFGSLAQAIDLAYASPSRRHADEAWRSLQAIADHVAGHWREPDHGIWEVRGPPARYTHSALMCWVALDRAARLAARRGLPERAHRWGEEREAIRQAILEDGWSSAKRSFVQVLGSDAIDASLLLVPLVGFLPGDDARVLATIDRVRRELGHGALVHRYREPDGLPGTEGAFLICGFWMVEALARAGRVAEACHRFDQLGRLGGPLGLFCEEADPATGAPLGNFPQALTHLGQIQAAAALTAALAPASGG